MYNEHDIHDCKSYTCPDHPSKLLRALRNQPFDNPIHDYFDVICVKELSKPGKIEKCLAEQAKKMDTTKYFYYGFTFNLAQDFTDEECYELCDKLLSCKSVSKYLREYVRALELTEAGTPHAHFFLKMERPLYAADLRKLKWITAPGIRFKLDSLKTKLDVIRWNSYLKKSKDTDIEHFGDLQIREWQGDVTTLDEHLAAVSIENGTSEEEVEQ